MRCLHRKVPMSVLQLNEIPFQQFWATDSVCRRIVKRPTCTMILLRYWHSASCCWACLRIPLISCSFYWPYAYLILVFVRLQDVVWWLVAVWEPASIPETNNSFVSAPVRLNTVLAGTPSSRLLHLWSHVWVGFRIWELRLDLFLIFHLHKDMPVKMLTSVELFFLAQVCFMQ